MKRIRNEIVLVAEEKGRIVGHICGNVVRQSWRRGTTAEIENMFVLNGFQGKRDRLVPLA